MDKDYSQKIVANVYLEWKKNYFFGFLLTSVIYLSRFNFKEL